MSFRVAILIVSDRAASGQRDDGCLAVFQTQLADSAFEICAHSLCSDDSAEITLELRSLLAETPHVIFTCGGTGCSKRDNTPEASAVLIDAPTPGIDEAIRRFSSVKAPFAIYSRAVSGFVGDTLLINLPGSPRAVGEILEFLLPTIEHPLKLRAGRISDCADESSL